jgi:hypothetical protein
MLLGRAWANASASVWYVTVTVSRSGGGADGAGGAQKIRA